MSASRNSAEEENLTEFITAVEEEYGLQDLASLSPQFSQLQLLNSKLKALKNVSIPESQHKMFVEYLLKYIEICLGFLTNHEALGYRKLRQYAIQLLNIIPDFFEEANIKDMFVKDATVKIFDLFLYGCFNTVGKKELLKVFNRIISTAKKQVRIDSAKSLMYYIYELIDCLSTYGDYVMQSDIMETLFRFYGNQIRHREIQYDLLPGSQELNDSLIKEISVDDFDIDVRRWLNKFNANSQLIFSIACKTLMFGNTVCPCPNEGPEVIWVDFDLKNQIVSFFSVDINSDNWNRIIILGKDVKKVEVKRQFRSNENTTVTLYLSKSCISESADNQEYWDSLEKHLTMVISNDDKDKITRLISQVLPQVFGHKFSHTSARISDTIKKVYKPLGIKISKRKSSCSELSGFTSIKSDTTHSDLQLEIPKLSSTRIVSSSLPKCDKNESPIPDIKHSRRCLNSPLQTDVSSEVVTDFTPYSSHGRNCTSGKESIISSNESESFQNISTSINSKIFQKANDKLQDNIVTSSYGFDDAAEARAKEFLSGHHNSDSMEFQTPEILPPSPFNRSQVIEIVDNGEFELSVKRSRQIIDNVEFQRSSPFKRSQFIGNVEFQPSKTLSFSPRQVVDNVGSQPSETFSSLSVKKSHYVTDVIDNVETLSSPLIKIFREVIPNQPLQATNLETVNQNKGNKAEEIKRSTLVLSEDGSTDKFETAVEDFNDNNSELSIIVKTNSPFVQGETEEENLNYFVNLDNENKATSSIQILDHEESVNKEQSDIFTQDLFEMATQPDPIKVRPEEKLSQNESENIFCQVTQQKSLPDLNSQSVDENSTDLSLAVNVGISESLYEKEVAVRVKKPEKEDNLALTVGEDDIFIVEQKNEETRVELVDDGNGSQALKPVEVVSHESLEESQYEIEATVHVKNPEKEDNFALTVGEDDICIVEQKNEETRVELVDDGNGSQALKPVEVVSHESLEESQYEKEAAVRVKNPEKEDNLALTVGEDDIFIVEQINEETRVELVDDGNASQALKPFEVVSHESLEDILDPPAGLRNEELATENAQAEEYKMITDAENELDLSKKPKAQKLYNLGSVSHLDAIQRTEESSSDINNAQPIENIEQKTKKPQKRLSKKKTKDENAYKENSKKENRSKKNTSIKKRKPRVKKDFFSTTTPFKSLDELFDRSCMNVMKRACAYDYNNSSRYGKSLLNGPLDIIVRSDPQNSSSEELFKLWNKNPLSKNSPEEHSSDFSWPELEQIPVNAGAQPYRKINVLQNILIKPKRPLTEPSDQIPKKLRRNDDQIFEENIPVPAPVDDGKHNVSERGYNIVECLGLIKYIIGLIETINDPASVQCLRSLIEHSRSLNII